MMSMRALAVLLLSFALQQPATQQQPPGTQTPGGGRGAGQRGAGPQGPPREERPPTHADFLRGEYGRYRANNDLLSYHLDVRIDPVAHTIGGKNTIRFKMLSDDTRIQLDLYANLNVDKILLGTAPLKYTREVNTVWVDFPETLKKGNTYAIDFYYSGTPKSSGRFGGFSFAKDPAGRPWI